MKTFRIAIACGSGGLIGALTALQFTALYFAWIGLIAGGVIGYIAYDFREVITASKTSFHYVMSDNTIELVKNSKNLVSMFPQVALWIDAILTAATSCFLVTTLMNTVNIDDRLRFFVAVPVFISLIFAIVASLGSLMLFFFLVISFVGIMGGEDPEECKKLLGVDNAVLKSPRVYLAFNPLTPVLISLLALPAIGLGALFYFGKVLYAVPYKKEGKKFLTAVRLFLWSLFVVVHSEERVLCFVDAALASFVGYFAGHFFLGLTGGLVIGVGSYEIVSKRILKLVPRTS